MQKAIWWYWNWKTQISPIQSPVSINNKYVNKMVVSNKDSFDKKGLKYFIG